MLLTRRVRFAQFYLTDPKKPLVIHKFIFSSRIIKLIYFKGLGFLLKKTRI